jgi:hypothetical protein
LASKLGIFGVVVGDEHFALIAASFPGNEGRIGLHAWRRRMPGIVD